MKKILNIILALVLLVCIFSSCSGNNNAQPQAKIPEPASNVNIGVLKGPTAMGFVKLMDEADTEDALSANYSFTITAAIDEITSKIVRGDFDIAAIPANLSSVLYNNADGAVQVLAINTLGVLYIVESGDTITTAGDLYGKTIYASGKGAVPEYALNYILSSNGIDPLSDTVIEWKSEPAECIAALSSNKNSIAMLPQPFVTTAQKSNENIRVALDLTEEWEKLQETADNPSSLITGVVVARTEFIEKNPDVIDDFLNRYALSVEYVNSNINEAAELIEKYDIIAASVAKEAIPYCNITFIDGEEMKEKLSGYLAVLFGENPQSVGGALPGDELYFGR